MTYLQRVKGDCFDCYFDNINVKGCPTMKYGVLACGANEWDSCFRLATPSEIAAYKRKHPESLAMKLSKYVHDHCTGVPHDIGLKLYDIVRAHPSELPKEASDGK